MPIYEYQCEACGRVSEEWQKITEEPLRDCTACGGVNTLHRLISNTSFVLKGNGWYVTDFRDKSPQKPDPGTHASPDPPAKDTAPSCACNAAESPAKSEPSGNSEGAQPASSTPSDSAGSSARAAASKAT